MILRYRAWKKAGKELGRLGQITFELDGSVSHVLFKGKFLDFNVPINEIELMQSTGLFDRNSKEIFEGDILDYRGRKALVRWHGSYASFIYRFVDEPHKQKAEWKPLYLAYMKCEIIGNIYENPEFLEDKK